MSQTSRTVLRWVGVVMALAVIPAQATQSLEDPAALARRAAFVFSGEVQRFEPGLRIAMPPRGIVVRVIDVLSAPPAVSVRAGDRVVVQLNEASSLKTGARAVFYTNGWIYDRYLTVREVGHTPSLAGLLQIKDVISRARTEAEDDSVRARLADAELVVAGEVRSVRPFEAANRRSPVTEHTANWWIAEIAVTQSLKGTVRQNTVAVAFPNSRDVMWADSPKFKEGDQGVWILHQLKSLAEFFAGTQDPVYTAINRRDFLSAAEAEHVRALLRSAPRSVP
jgi:hypothetical protein